MLRWNGLAADIGKISTTVNGRRPIYAYRVISRATDDDVDVFSYRFVCLSIGCFTEHVQQKKCAHSLVDRGIGPHFPFSTSLSIC